MYGNIFISLKWELLKHKVSKAQAIRWKNYLQIKDALR